jgi:adenylosuccinate synthase
MAEVRDLCSSFEAGALFEKMFKENIDYLVAFYSEFAGKVRIVPDDRLKELFLGPVVFEGAQGMLLDETWGFAPHNSWTDITFTNALKLIKGISIPTSRIGVLRTHFTRHGAGPFPTEDPAISFQDHNTVGPWQGAFRFGRFDLVLARYALEKIGGVDEIVLTHQDCLPDGVMEFHDCYEVATECFTRLHLPDTELLTMARPGPIRRATPESVCHMRLGIPIRKG